ncbi:hypothetical protein B0A49_09043 [Cryomyces minteri]|uniref:Uncharacterized protein n=1 Tax=Cryomyces minteri TaxID=331657 RepID=A0A4U0WJQ4_9PEZI|nr:hypothetical protein B0A49_09043 [Cryomyces minteri]
MAGPIPPPPFPGMMAGPPPPPPPPPFPQDMQQGMPQMGPFVQQMRNMNIDRNLANGPRPTEDPRMFQPIAVPTTYREWTLHKAPVEGEDPTWARVTKNPMPFGTEDLLKRVKARKEKSRKDVMEDFRALTSDSQRLHVERLIEEQMWDERNPNVEWVLASVEAQTRHNPRYRTRKETTALHVILKRRLKPSVAGAAGAKPPVTGEVVDIRLPLKKDGRSDSKAKGPSGAPVPSKFNNGQGQPPMQVPFQRGMNMPNNVGARFPRDQDFFSPPPPPPPPPPPFNSQPPMPFPPHPPSGRQPGRPPPAPFTGQPMFGDPDEIVDVFEMPKPKKPGNKKAQAQSKGPQPMPPPPIDRYLPMPPTQPMAPMGKQNQRPPPFEPQPMPPIDQYPPMGPMPPMGKQNQRQPPFEPSLPRKSSLKIPNGAPFLDEEQVYKRKEAKVHRWRRDISTDDEEDGESVFSNLSGGSFTTPPSTPRSGKSVPRRGSLYRPDAHRRQSDGPIYPEHRKPAPYRGETPSPPQDRGPPSGYRSERRKESFYMEPEDSYRASRRPRDDRHYSVRESRRERPRVHQNSPPYDDYSPIGATSRRRSSYSRSPPRRLEYGDEADFERLRQKERQRDLDRQEWLRRGDRTEREFRERKEREMYARTDDRYADRPSFSRYNY